LKNEAQKAGIPVVVERVGSMMGMFFTDQPVHRFADAKTSDLERFTDYYQGMLAEGVYLAPSQFEALFVSAAHTEADIDATLAAAGRVMARLAG
jgi:glutamate-1-semialdehyde 2,1-aminomutase